MGQRGRLIWPFQARIQRLDTAGTAANAIAGQPSGYDRFWREEVSTNSTDARVYTAPVAVSCQVRTEMGAYERLQQFAAGREREYDLKLILHYNELETLGLIGADGGVVFQPSDKLIAIYKKDGTTLVKNFADKPLYCVQVQDRSWGLSGLERNLVMLYFKDRREAAQ